MILFFVTILFMAIIRYRMIKNDSLERQIEVLKIKLHLETITQQYREQLKGYGDELEQERSE